MGFDKPIVSNDAIRLLENLTKQKAQILRKRCHPEDVMATWADIAKAEHLLGWRPQRKFEDGLAKLVQWYEANREWARELRTD